MNDAEFRQRYEEACALYDGGDYSGALALIDEAAGARPGSPSLLYARALCLSGLRRYDEALEACNVLIREYHDVRGVQLTARIAAAMDDAADAHGSLDAPAQTELPAASELTADSEETGDPPVESLAGIPPKPDPEAQAGVGTPQTEEDDERDTPEEQAVHALDTPSVEPTSAQEAAPETAAVEEAPEDTAAAGPDSGAAADTAASGPESPEGEQEEASPEDAAPAPEANHRGLRRTALLGTLLIAVGAYYAEQRQAEGWMGVLSSQVLEMFEALDLVPQGEEDVDSPAAPEDSADLLKPDAETSGRPPGKAAAVQEPAAHGKVPATSTESPQEQASPMDAAPIGPPGAQTLVCPEGQVLGRLQMRPWDAGSETPWEPLGSVAGTVQIPAGVALRLTVNDHHWLDLRWWAEQAPAALTDVSLANGDVTNQRLGHLAAFPGLRGIELHHTYAVTNEGLAVLRNFPGLRRLVLDGLSLLTDDAFAHVTSLQGLRELDISNTPFQETALAGLAALTDLDTLAMPSNAADASLEPVGALRFLTNLSIGPEITGEGLSALAALPRLRKITWSGAFSAEALGRLARFPALEDLTLAGDADPEGLGELAGSTSLARLALLDNILAPAHLSHLAEFRQLHALRLEPANPTPVALTPAEAIEFMRGLEELRTAGPAFDDSLLATAAKLPILRRLEAPGTAITEGGLVPLAKAAELRELVLDHTPLTDAAVAPLAACKELSLLSLVDTRMTDDGLDELEAQLPRCRIRRRDMGESERRILFPMNRSVGVVYELLQKESGLERVLLGRAKGAITMNADHSLMLVVREQAEKDLTFLRHLRPYDVQVLVIDHGNVQPEELGNIAHLRYLESLTLSGPAIGDPALEHLAPLDRLRHLSLQRTAITDAGLSRIPELFPRLEHLGLPGCMGVTAEGARHIAALGGLRTLVLSGTPLDDGALAQLRVLLLLESVWLDGTAVTDEGIAEFTRALPDCRVVTGGEAPPNALH